MDFIEKIKIILPKEKNLDLVIREVKIDYNLVELMFFSSLCNEDRLIYLISSIKKKVVMNNYRSGAGWVICLKVPSPRRGNER